MLDQYIPVLMQLGIATGFAISTLLVSVLLGKSAKSNQIKDSAYAVSYTHLTLPTTPYV